MTTAQTTPAAEGGYAEAHAFANALRSVADVIDDGGIEMPTSSIRIYCTAFGSSGREAFLAARRAFPAATVDAATDEYYVAIVVGSGVRLLFDKHGIGTRTEVQVPGVEYVIDPELLAPIDVAAEAQHRETFGWAAVESAEADNAAGGAA